MTPLIDVVFILLVFFMLESSFLEQRVLPLTLASSLSADVDAREVIEVEVGARGGAIVSGETWTSGAWAARTAELAKSRDATVVLLTSGDVSVQRLVDALEALERLQVVDVSLERSP